MTDDRDDRPMSDSEEDRAYALAVIAAAIFPYTRQRYGTGATEQERAIKAVLVASKIHDAAVTHVLGEARERRGDEWFLTQPTEAMERSETMTEILILSREEWEAEMSADHYDPVSSDGWWGRRDATIAALAEAWRKERRARLKCHLILAQDLTECAAAGIASEPLVKAGWLDEGGGDDARD